MLSRIIGCLVITTCFIAPMTAAEFGMKTGSPQLESLGALTFGNDGILFAADPMAATVYAFDTQDNSGDPAEVSINIEEVDRQAASILGTEKVTILDLAINPQSGNGYISVSSEDNKTHAICRLLPSGNIERMPLTNIDHSKVELPNAPENKEVGKGRRKRNYRPQSITDLAFIEGKLLVSGVAGNNRESNVRELIFPFYEADKGINVEIFHGAHGRYENDASVRTFVPFEINGEPYLLAGFVCTPLVKFPLGALQGKETVRATTLAELGNWNQPLDMFVYSKQGKKYVLMSNSARGVMKISTDDVEREVGITERVKDTAGQPFETIESWVNIEQMDKLNANDAVVIARSETGSRDVRTVALP